MSTVLDAKLLSIFSKACYCRDTSDNTQNMQKTLLNV